MRVVHISSADYGSGASRVAYRLHGNLLNRGIDSRMVVGFKLTDDPTVIGSGSKLNKLKFMARRTIDTLPQKFYRHRKNLPWSNQFLPGSLVRRALELKPDIINLHWISNGAMSLKELAAVDVPLVWVLHDYWPITGGCHLIGDCTGYQHLCGSCPQLNSSRVFDLSRLNLARKKRFFENHNLTLVAPSRWVAKCAGTATAVAGKNIRVISHGLDPEKFIPVSKDQAKRKIGIDPQCKVVLFGSANALGDHNKGFDLFLSALTHLSEDKSIGRMRVVVFGADESHPRPQMPFDTDFHGYILDDERLNLFYAAADVMVVPSRQETFCQTVLEAFSCKTPVVAFDSTGPRDVIEHRKTGYLATPYDPVDLCYGIKWVIEDRPRLERLSENARQLLFDKFTIDIMTDNYRDLYRSILAG